MSKKYLILSFHIFNDLSSMGLYAAVMGRDCDDDVETLFCSIFLIFLYYNLIINIPN